MRIGWSGPLLVALLAGSVGPLGAQGASSPDSLPTPVLLVPGWGDGEPALDPLRARFIEAGWRPGRVAAVSFDDPFGSNREHAEEVAVGARELREATGVERIDVVAHSMGGLAVRYHLASAGGAGVRRVVFLATPHRGTVTAHVAWGEGAEEMKPGSSFLDSLNALPPVPEGVRALSLRTVLDLRILPGSSAVLRGDARVRNVEVCCPTHPGLLDDSRTFRLVRDFLRSGSRGLPAAAGEGSGPDPAEPERRSGVRGDRSGVRIADRPGAHDARRSGSGRT